MGNFSAMKELKFLGRVVQMGTQTPKCTRVWGAAMVTQTEIAAVTPEMIEAGVRVLIDSGVLGTEPPTGALLPDVPRYSDEHLVAAIYRAMISTRSGAAESYSKAG